MNTIKMSIEGMMCEKCSAKAKAALMAVPGVEAAEVDEKKGKAVIKCSENVKEEDLCMAVLDVGFKPKIKHGLF